MNFAKVHAVHIEVNILSGSASPPQSLAAKCSAADQRPTRKATTNELLTSGLVQEILNTRKCTRYSTTTTGRTESGRWLNTSITQSD